MNDQAFNQTVARTVAQIACTAHAALAPSLPDDAVTSVEINRQRRLVVTTASGERYEVDVRKEGERIARTLVPALRHRALVMMPIGLQFNRRSKIFNGGSRIEFGGPGRE
jgi:hypothetical protein